DAGHVEDDIAVTSPLIVEELDLVRQQNVVRGEVKRSERPMRALLNSTSSILTERAHSVGNGNAGPLDSSHATANPRHHAEVTRLESLTIDLVLHPHTTTQGLKPLFASMRVNMHPAQRSTEAAECAQSSLFIATKEYVRKSVHDTDVAENQ